MLLVFNSNPSKLGATRYTDFEWAPRWMTPYYSAKSTFRQLYFLSLHQPREEFEQFSEDIGIPKFYGHVALPRIGHIANYTYNNNIGYLPTIVFTCSGITTSVQNVENLSSLLYSKDFPVWTISEGILYLNNLALVSYAVTASSGFIDLTSIYQTDPPLPDSLLSIQNQYNDIFYYDPTSPLLNGTSLYVGIDGPYTFSFISQNVLNLIEQGQYVLQIGSSNITITTTYFPNKWDTYTTLSGYSRKPGIDNVITKKQCQQLSLVKDPIQRIATILNQSESILWADQTPLNLSGSGFVYSTVFPLINKNYLSEIPVQVGTNYILTNIPSGPIQLFLEDIPIDPSCYVVSGSTIIPLTQTLSGATNSDVLVDYSVTNYEVQNNVLTRNNLGSETVYVVWTKNVQANTSTLVIDSWNWNIQYGDLTGLAVFNT